MVDFDDRELLALLKRGSLEAYEILFKKYYGLLCLQANILLKDEAEAEDLVQELFVEIWDKKIYKQIDHSLKAYLYCAVKNRCLNLIQKNKLIRERLKSYDETRSTKKDPGWIEQGELATNIKTILNEFPPQRQKVFSLVYMENKRYQEAADEMGISINSVKTHLKLALKIFRVKLKKFR